MNSQILNCKMRIITAFALLVSPAWAFVGKYDISKIPFDLRPVTNLVGVWRRTAVRGNTPRVIIPPDVLDVGINPEPKFGSRALNMTAHFTSRSDQHEFRTDYGFMPVKNATRFDPRWHCAILTTSSAGYSMLEQGVVKSGPQIRTHLKQFLRRSFDMGDNAPDLVVEALERLIRVTGPQSMEMTVETITNRGDDDYTAEYVRYR